MIVMIVRLFSIDAQVAFAAEFDGRITHLDAHALPAPAAQPPQFGGGKRGCADRGLRCRTDRE